MSKDFNWSLTLFLVASDLTLAVAALLLATVARGVLPIGSELLLSELKLGWHVYGVSVGALAVSYGLLNSYHLRSATGLGRALKSATLPVIFAIALLTAALYYLFSDISRLQLGYFSAFYLGLVVVQRTAAFYFFKLTGRSEKPTVGTGSTARRASLGLMMVGIVVLSVSFGLFTIMSNRTSVDVLPSAVRPRIRSVAFADFPVALAFAPDGRLFFTEKSGSVWVIKDGVVQRSAVLTLPTNSAGSRGMLGIAVDPDFENNHYIWIYHTTLPLEEGGPHTNQVVRFTERDGFGLDPRIALSVPVPKKFGGLHYGGNIHFGPEGRLYLTIGDHGSPINAQNMETLPGKIHRFIPDVPLGIPDDNPFPDSSIYALGLRNSFDFAFDPADGTLFATENGPDCDDEINLIVPGANYGWMEEYQCSAHLLDKDYPFSAPLLFMTPTEAPTGIVVYQGEEFEQLNGKLLFCLFKSGALYVATLNDARDQVILVEEIDLGNASCQLDILEGPDGRLYFTSLTRIFVMENPDR